MTRKASGRAKKPVTRKKSPMLDLMKGVDATAKKREVSMFNLSDFEETYGVKFFISTGLPDFDLMLMNDGDKNLSGSQPYGWPTGRIVEICGDEQSFKTWFTHSASARVRQMGGLVFLIQSENDFDLSFYQDFYDKKGLDFKKEVEPYVRASMATTVGEVIKVLKVVTPNIRAHYEEGGEAVPILIVLDSLAAMFSTQDLENFESEKGPQVGSHASEIHKMFKYVMEDLGRYNITFMVTNQYRANIGPSRKTKQPAHNNTVRYYASCRVETSAYVDKSCKATSLGQEYIKAKKMRVKITKIRNPLTADGELELMFYMNHGFDYLGSLINAMRLSGVIKKTARSYEFLLDETKAEAGEAVLYSKLSEMDKLSIGVGNIRTFLKENKELIPSIEKLVFSNGPRKFAKLDDEVLV